MRTEVIAEVTAGRGESVAHMSHRIKHPGTAIPTANVDGRIEEMPVLDSDVQAAVHELVAQGVIYASGNGWKLVGDIGG